MNNRPSETNPIGILCEPTPARNPLNSCCICILPTLFISRRFVSLASLLSTSSRMEFLQSLVGVSACGPKIILYRCLRSVLSRLQRIKFVEGNSLRHANGDSQFEPPTQSTQPEREDDLRDKMSMPPKMVDDRPM